MDILAKISRSDKSVKGVPSMFPGRVGHNVTMFANDLEYDQDKSTAVLFSIAQNFMGTNSKMFMYQKEIFSEFVIELPTKYALNDQEKPFLIDPIMEPVEEDSGKAAHLKDKSSLFTKKDELAKKKELMESLNADIRTLGSRLGVFRQKIADSKFSERTEADKSDLVGKEERASNNLIKKNEELDTVRDEISKLNEEILELEAHLGSYVEPSEDYPPSEKGLPEPVIPPSFKASSAESSALPAKKMYFPVSKFQYLEDPELRNFCYELVAALPNGGQYLLELIAAQQIKPMAHTAITSYFASLDHTVVQGSRFLKLVAVASVALPKLMTNDFSRAMLNDTEWLDYRTTATTTAGLVSRMMNAFEGILVFSLEDRNQVDYCLKNKWDVTRLNTWNKDLIALTYAYCISTGSLPSDWYQGKKALTYVDQGKLKAMQAFCNRYQTIISNVEAISSAETLDTLSFAASEVFSDTAKLIDGRIGRGKNVELANSARAVIVEAKKMGDDYIPKIKADDADLDELSANLNATARAINTNALKKFVAPVGEEEDEPG